MHLLSDEYVLRLLDQSRGPYPGIVEEYLKDPSCGPPLRAYLEFTAGRIGADLSKSDRLYNRYYWLLRFARLHRARFEPDAGIEEQVSQILEYADCDLEADAIEEIEQKA